MNAEQKDQALNKLYEAQEYLGEAIDALQEYVELTDDQEAKCYLVDHLNIMYSSDHGFLSSDLNIDDLIERVSY